MDHDALVWYDCIDPSIKTQCYNFPDWTRPVIVNTSVVYDDKFEDAIAWITESPDIIDKFATAVGIENCMDQIREKMETGQHKFRRLYTYDKRFEGLPNTHVVGYCPAPTWIEPENLKVHPKTKFCSLIASDKTMTPTQAMRVSFTQSVLRDYPDEVDCFGRGVNEIDKKSDALRDYCFSYAIENVSSDSYFTEKILDCFLTGTVPLYYGDPCIGDVFDRRGIINIKDHEGGMHYMDGLNMKLYESMLPYVEKNYEIAMQIKNRPQDIFSEIIKIEEQYND